MTSDTNRQQATEVVFLTSQYDDAHGSGKTITVDCYTPHDLAWLRLDLTRYIEFGFSAFPDGQYDDAFSCASYGGPMDLINEEEESVFRSVLDEGERGRRLYHLHPRDQFNGLQAVIRTRLTKGDLDSLRAGFDLFNFVMECGLSNESKDPCCRIELQTAKEFAPSPIDNLIEAVETVGDPGLHYGRRLLAEAFLPLEPLLRALSGTVHHEAWPHSDWAVGKFLLIVDRYKEVVE